MFKNYYCTTQKDQEIELINLTYGYQGIILTIEIFGGQQDGVLTFNKYNNGELIFTQDLIVDRKEPIALDHKILIPQNYSFKVLSNISGIRVCANVVLETETYYFNPSTNSTESTNSINSISPE